MRCTRYRSYRIVPPRIQGPHKFKVPALVAARRQEPIPADCAPSCRVVLWEYYSKWSGEQAATFYKGPIMKTSKKKRGAKASYLIAEDNDPAGYKSGKGKQAKRDLGIKTVAWPRYSPDLNPLDFSLWRNIEQRVDKTAPRGRESVTAFKARLRRVALRTSTVVVRNSVEDMRQRARMIWESSGGDITKD